MIRIGKLPSNFGPASVLGAAVGALSGTLGSKVLCQLPLPFVIQNWDQHLAGWLALRLHGLNPVFFADIATKYQYFLDTTGVPAWQFTGRFDLAAVVGFGVAAGLTWLIGRPLPDTKIVAGRHLYQGKVAQKYVREIAKDEIANSGHGVQLHPSFDWAISRGRATRGIFVWGSIGGGKTQIIYPMVMAAIRQGDKVLIHDVKGDFTSDLDCPFALLAPWDARTMAWDIARDCLDAQEANELAVHIIPESKDPMWSQAARQVLGAIIQSLQYNKGSEWTWLDLYKQAIASQDELIRIVKEMSPEAELMLASESKTTEGILITYAAALKVVANLARVWGRSKPENRFSISEWLCSENPKYKTVVLQNSGKYQELAHGYLHAFISLLSGRIDSPQFGDSKERRTWLFFDEFPALGALPRFSAILERGRSKGICTVCSSQDLGLLENVYGTFLSKAWSSIIGTQIIVRTNAGETADYLSKVLVGYARTEKTTVHKGENQAPIYEDRLVLEPSDISDFLGTDREGVTAAVLGFGNVNILKWPYTTGKKMREGSVPAAWTLRPASPSNSGIKKQPQKQGETKMNEEQKKPRIILRAPTRDEILDMANSGSDIKDAADPVDEMDPEFDPDEPTPPKNGAPK